MLALKLAFRNIPAHGQRNAIIAIVIAAVSMVLFLFLTFSDGEMENIRNGVAGFYSPPADLFVRNSDYQFAADRHQTPQEKTLTKVSELRQAFEMVPGVASVVPSLSGWGFDLFAKGKKYLGFNTVAIWDNDSFLRSKYTIIAGQDIPDGASNQVLLHQVARESIPVAAGDVVALVGKDLFGQAVSLDLTVAGFYAPVSDYPDLYSALLMDAGSVATINGYDPNEANSIRVRVKSGFDLQQVRFALTRQAQTIGHSVDVRLASEEANQNGQEFVFGMVRLIIIVMVLLTLLITGFGIMNIVALNLQDRSKEIGTYFCLGSETPFLLRLYTYEILFVNLGGAVVGIFLGLAIRTLINALNITSADAGFQMVMGGSRFVLGLSTSSVLWILGGVALITITTALTSLGKALKVAPVEAVREME